MVQIDFYVNNERSIELFQIDKKHFIVEVTNLKTGGICKFEPMTYKKALTCFTANMDFNRI